MHCCVLLLLSVYHKRKFYSMPFFGMFSYCPFVWMCHSRIINNKINRLHEKGLRLIYHDKHSTFHGLLKKDCSVSIHTRSLQFRVTEIHKLAKDISPIMQEIFRLRNSSKYNLRSQKHFRDSI